MDTIFYKIFKLWTKGEEVSIGLIYVFCSAAILGDRLGWREMRNWLNYEDLTFTLNAPHGHLPWLGRLGGWLGAFGVWSGSFIAQKAVACHL
ncbi:GUN4 domain-containing protein [Argonema galeatum]|uniref:GUN4 domain-containing protein n=1 Tax=Argonema galeatum TaxID=2942762 RepID=UPI0020129842|nr:GUN4 domain-containing protein [Argonema galeatum]MCL1464539.1 GUN4 domain-containing protein [Argonema galeatum A003/A1]